MTENSLKTVLITGCSSGFGRLMMDRFVKSGRWKVFATSRNAAELHDAQSDNLIVLPSNVAESLGRNFIVERVNSLIPHGLDCLINNAGYGVSGPLETLSEEQIRQQFEVNFFAPLLLTRDLLPSLRKSHGRVINISSVLGFVGMPLQSLYVASKFALEGLSESLSYELGVHGVQVCLVEPGGFRTKFAQNIDWANHDVNTKAAAVYENQVLGYRAFLSKKLERPGSDPGKVADAVFELCHRNKMPLRLRVGSDTQTLYYMRRALPQAVSDLILQNASKKLLGVR
ncbi:MAG TPA: SDR family oxidoreductase [Drouetiella sp.]|jgi:NAD(P)-dependent dehydrogenase (short-subunit alcohol dehydrogenase family)